jgi:hypothetical protein
MFTISYNTRIHVVKHFYNIMQLVHAVNNKHCNFNVFFTVCHYYVLYIPTVSQHYYTYVFTEHITTVQTQHNT